MIYFPIIVSQFNADNLNCNRNLGELRNGILKLVLPQHESMIKF